MISMAVLQNASSCMSTHDAHSVMTLDVVLRHVHVYEPSTPRLRTE